MAIIVASFYRMLETWAWPHILQEHLKRVRPSITYGDATAAVYQKPMITRIQHSLFHIRPYAVFGGFPPLSTSAPSVSEQSFGRQFAVQTATALLATFQFAVQDFYGLTASTYTGPHFMITPAQRFMRNRQATKLLARKNRGMLFVHSAPPDSVLVLE